jgi:hypothetical protein
MRFTDSRGRRHTLTRIQANYLELGATWRQAYRGWGGHGSTLTVRLLEERGLITVDWRTGPGWKITGLTRLGREVLGRWKTQHQEGQS